jgi:hypothetical protein
MRVTSRLALAALTVVLVLTLAAVAAGVAGAAPGSVAWKKVLNPTAEFDGLYLGASGPSSTFYACGTKGWPDVTRFWLVKYKATGAKAWSRTWTGPDANSDDVSDVAVDGHGNAYVAGRTRRTSGEWDTVVLKYDAGGHLKWAVVYPAAAVESDDARAIGLDAAGNVYVVGTAYRAGDWDVYTARFRPSDGLREWTSWYDGSSFDLAWSIAVTGAGDCYAAGETDNIAQPEDALLVKTTAAGDFAWAKTWGAAGDSHDMWETVKLARGGGVIVAGTTDYLDDSDVVIARYAADGQRQWVHTWSSSGSYDDGAVEAAVARDGSVWVAAETDRGGDNRRGALVKWSPAGKRLVARPLGSATWPVRPSDLVLDLRGSVFVSGSIKAAGGGTNALAARYSPAGKKRWVSKTAFAGKTRDGLDVLVLGGAGYLYGCGEIGTDVANSRGFVVKIRR